MRLLIVRNKKSTCPSCGQSVDGIAVERRKFRTVEKAKDYLFSNLLQFGVVRSEKGLLIVDARDDQRKELLTDSSGNVEIWR